MGKIICTICTSSFIVIDVLCLQPRCQLCDAEFSTDDAVLEHLVKAHPSATLASFVTSQRGRPLLVHHDYVYSYSKNNSHNNKHFWSCEHRSRSPLPSQDSTNSDVTTGGGAKTTKTAKRCRLRRACRGRVITHGQSKDDVTSVVVSATEHTHPPAPSRVRLYVAMHRLRTRPLDANVTPLLLRQQVANEFPDIADQLPSLDGFRKRIQQMNKKKRSLTSAATMGDNQVASSYSSTTCE